MQVSPRLNVPLRARRTIHIPPPGALACASFPVWRLLIATAVPARARAPGYLETSCPWRLAVDHEIRRLRARGLVPAGRPSRRKLGMRPNSGWIARVLGRCSGWIGMRRSRRDREAGLPYEERLEDQPSD